MKLVVILTVLEEGQDIVIHSGKLPRGQTQARPISHGASRSIEELRGPVLGTLYPGQGGMGVGAEEPAGRHWNPKGCLHCD